MHLINARNVHQALPQAIDLLARVGVERRSRNGPVLVSPDPVATTYERPIERVVFWPHRDANPAFHVFESLYMLAGRNDLAGLQRYIKDFGRYSDDGATLAGAYGFRWRRAFGRDQLAHIVHALQNDPCDRRQVLQMWDSQRDLVTIGKDVCCNLVATFQIGVDGRLDMLVTQRSGDIIWGVYGANAVHFAVLQEYVARCIGCELGTFTHVTANYHAYLDTLAAVADLPARTRGLYSVPTPLDDPYRDDRVRVVPMPSGTQAELDATIRALLSEADEGYDSGSEGPDRDTDPWAYAQMLVLRAHHEWRTNAAPERYTRSLAVLDEPAVADVDWIVAMRQWLERREAVWHAKQEVA